ncbi:MAG: hypothetical protein COT25_04415 [Candidatus Kerfeldbacteria bacterium CG08_land_8_20_14_0_20_42_7]|uniref:Heat-inducible transcription repressor HrcA C-terminal domain-containing protein n=1 Tax=Candidatus Kerfeldbacteria bacterium CG08_land_8_20_14_0_20_42_7 TaxID=2014245 RepID=A0A2H0YRR3_9BACT|nr:MAG: hypothetical protein COT25_04415 [Candidatus Kerfeldbacteria bacterium CG08_land_8_20_14_0_20_42_7]
MLEPRKKQLFSSLIAEHIRSAAPVGSRVLAENPDIRKSSATVRNDLVELEEKGLITHPHTSAGRIPTAKGWKYYIEELMQEQQPAHKAQEQLARIASDKKLEVQDMLKSVARTLAELSENASIVAFSRNDVYYTGLSNIFSKPEFSELELVRNMSEVIDHLDEVVEKLFQSVKPGTHVLVGQENPFGADCGAVIHKTQAEGRERMFGILGPMRMNYAESRGLVTYTAKLLTN